MGSRVERSPDALAKRYQSPLNPLSHLSWMKSALHPSSGATNRCILQLHAPSCLHSDPFVWRRCYSKVGTPAEFKWGGPEWSDAGRLAGGSGFHGLILATQSVDLNISAQPAAHNPAGRHRKTHKRWTQDRPGFVWGLCFPAECIRGCLVILLARSLLWSTCGINSLSDELPWLDLQEDVYDWGLFLLRPPPQLPARYTRPARAENQCGWGRVQLELPYQSVCVCVCVCVVCVCAHAMVSQQRWQSER